MNHHKNHIEKKTHGKESRHKYIDRIQKVLKSINIKQKLKNINIKQKTREALPWIISSAIISLITLFVSKKISPAIASFFIAFVMLEIYSITKIRLKDSERTKRIEEVFPDFIELAASNLRAGMTVERALILSSRKEFAPLDKEILDLGKNILTGKEIEEALVEMSKKIKSEKISKTINLIMTGLRSGGNLSILLEETAQSMRERAFVEKRAASNVLMYVIFIIFAIAVGAPMLFALSTVLVEVMTTIITNIPVSTTTTNINLPFTLTQINISTTFVTYFALIFMLLSTFLASMVLGLVMKGNEKEGVKYSLPLAAVAVIVYFAIKIALTRYFSGFF